MLVKRAPRDHCSAVWNMSISIDRPSPFIANCPRHKLTPLRERLEPINNNSMCAAHSSLSKQLMCRHG